MIALDRRTAVGGLLAGLVCPQAHAVPSPPPMRETVRRLLDRAAALPPAEGHTLLDGIDAGPLDIATRLDLLTARAGLACDAALARFGRPGRTPYRVGPRSGKWLRAVTADPIDAECAAVVADAQQGVILPRLVLDDTVAAMRARRAEPAVAAALERFVQALLAMRRHAPEPGMIHLPGGAQRYALLLRRHGVHHAPAEIDRRLAREEAALTASANALFAAIGDTHGSLGERYARLWSDPHFLYSEDEAGRARAIRDMNATLATIRNAMRPILRGAPAWLLDVAVEPMTAKEIATGTQGYRRLPTPDAPGAYVVDLRRMAERPSWTLASVVAHELLPGHMLQWPWEQISPPHPLRLEYAVGYTEGWAIFAEACAHRRGWLGRNPRVALGHLHWLLFRIGRARADLAIHWRGIPLQRVRRRLTAIMGRPAYFIDFDADLGRILLEPGIRVAEASSYLAFSRLDANDLETSMTHILPMGRVPDALVAVRST